MLDRSQQVDQASSEPVDCPAKYDIEVPVAAIIQHPVQAWPIGSRLAAGNTSIGVDLDHFPASTFGNLPQLDFLVFDGLAICADEQVKRRAARGAFGRALDFFKQAWPRLPAFGIDMSEAYVAEARRHLKRWCWINFIIANGEAIPLDDASQDAVTSIFLFHELRIVLRELARVLKRGGRGILVDSLQMGDEPGTTACWSCFLRVITNPTTLVISKKTLARWRQLAG